MIKSTELLLKEFLALIGLELVPELMKDGLLSLAVDDSVTITIGECPAEQLVMCAMIGPVSQERALRLLAANAFNEQTCPVLFAYDESSQEGFAWCRLPTSIDAGGMYRHFHEFITAVLDGVPSEEPVPTSVALTSPAALSQKWQLARR